MTALHPTVALRRATLAHALHDLPPLNATMLLHLTLRACPTTGRVWTTVVRLADDLDLSPALVEHTLSHLMKAGYLRTIETVRGPLQCLELGPVFIRDTEAPANLPVEVPV